MPGSMQILGFWYRSVLSDSNMSMLRDTVPPRGSGINVVNFRDEAMTITKHAFPIPYAIVFGTFYGSQKAWTTPFLVPLRGQKKNFRRASPTLSYGNPPTHPPGLE